MPTILKIDMHWVTLAFRAAALSARLAALLPIILLKRKWGIRAFKKELARKGIDSLTIEQLTEVYEEIGDVRKWIRLYRES